MNPLPEWSAKYFFTKLPVFAPTAIATILMGIASSILSYIVAGRIRFGIDNIDRINPTKFSLLLLFVIFAKELIGYFTRRYSEGLIIRFKDWIRVELFYDICQSIKFCDNDPSDLKSAMDEYLSSCYYLLSMVVFSLPSRLTGIIISLIVVYNMGKIPFIINISSLAIFFFVSFLFSKKYIIVSKPYSESVIKLETTLTNLFLSIDYLVRNRINKDYHTQEMSNKWDKYQKVKNLHGARWFWQLFPFNAIYIISLGFLVYRIQNGQNTIGDFALAQWYYGVLLGSFIFITESLTDLAKQRTASYVAWNKINALVFHAPRKSPIYISDDIAPGIHLVVGGNGVGKTTALYSFLARHKSVSYFSGERYPTDIPESSGQIQMKMTRKIANSRSDRYIFDEPCSHTDNTEWFEEILHKFDKSKTVIVVSHKTINYDWASIIGEIK